MLRPNAVSKQCDFCNYWDGKGDFETAQISLLPLLTDNAHSLALIKHVMKTISEGTKHLNPGQIPVVEMD